MTGRGWITVLVLVLVVVSCVVAARVADGCVERGGVLTRDGCVVRQVP